MIRVLQVYPQLNNAGTEMVIFNLYKNIDRNKIQFDFLVEKPGELDSVVKSMDGKIFYINELEKKQYLERLVEFFYSHKEYNIVHTHTHQRMGEVLQAASIAGVKTRIAHSHNSRTDLPRIFSLYKRITSRRIEKYATDLFACSVDAAKWLYPCKYKQCKIIHNSIELQKFSYNQMKRNTMRLNLSIKPNVPVICHIGRFARQKNHKFLIDVAHQLVSKCSLVKFILVGVGPLQDNIRNRTKEYGIADNIFFLENRSDVSDILAASDIFVFPSLYEGLGIVLIEAQASGLRCVVSDKIPSEADLGLNLIKRKSLSDGASLWADTILQELSMQNNREFLSNSALLSDYDIRKTTKLIEQFYLERAIL
ncbi:hypothetical protein AB840_01900 [Megasphaera cerevisiae DSM 20462]|uniref:Glycosyl transferase family 1 domain-containing protein n=1 Tax=Megasphaera cerevisiae DSM 20462 TaxID=1122219 RepID=A0A0J6WVX7_9FIRM|nr:glycosyltransferase [Megasphaera cerevisiae]KMO87670.1 hypothetical protein AB840_01900 [Megasphaera cerevisiae DSM 20462]SKA06702.1 Glycosyltransferase involved in cell wall bisynthesis [Megasphaera cerevisiae DSM 20462]